MVLLFYYFPRYPVLPLKTPSIITSLLLPVSVKAFSIFLKNFCFVLILSWSKGAYAAITLILCLHILMFSWFHFWLFSLWVALSSLRTPVNIWTHSPVELEPAPFFLVSINASLSRLNFSNLWSDDDDDACIQFIIYYLIFSLITILDVPCI